MTRHRFALAAQALLLAGLVIAAVLTAPARGSAHPPTAAVTGSTDAAAR